jgi:HD-GYP domain-containing protein (c-di-GMP phosphodiesterase class II)
MHTKEENSRMVLKSKLLTVKELKAGMIVDSDIVQDGKILVAKGVKITEPVLNKLKDNYVFNRIQVIGEFEEDTEEPYKIKQKSIEEIEEDFTKFSSEVEDIFSNIQNIQISGMEEVREFIKTIQKEFSATSTIIKNIVLYGSGKDAIYRHSVNVAALSSILGKWIGLTDKDINLLVYSAILHDFGKTKISPDIINKVEPLFSKELKEIKTHPVIGYNFVKEIPFLDKSVSYGVLMHHERMDGSGYPLGVKAEAIHQFAKIIAIADVFDAINSDRVFKKSKKPFEALEIIHKESLGRLDYEYCKIFLSHIVNYYMGENVLLNNNMVCKIIQIDVNDIEKPLLLGDSGFVDLKKQKDLFVEKLVL